MKIIIIRPTSVRLLQTVTKRVKFDALFSEGSFATPDFHLPLAIVVTSLSFNVALSMISTRLCGVLFG